MNLVPRVLKCWFPVANITPRTELKCPTYFRLPLGILVTIEKKTIEQRTIWERSWGRDIQFDLILDLIVKIERESVVVHCTTLHSEFYLLSVQTRPKRKPFSFACLNQPPRIKRIRQIFFFWQNDLIQNSCAIASWLPYLTILAREYIYKKQYYFLWLRSSFDLRPGYFICSSSKICLSLDMDILFVD